MYGNVYKLLFILELMDNTKEEIKKEKDPKKRILMALTEPLNATTKVALTTGLHYYRVERFLYELVSDGLVEEIKVNKYKYWKKLGEEK